MSLARQAHRFGPTASANFPAFSRKTLAKMGILRTSGFIPDNTRRFPIIVEIANGPVLDSLNRIVNHRNRKEKPFSRFDRSAKTIFQFQVQSSAAEKLVQ